MSTFTTSITIDAPSEKVWAALADIGSIADWNPGLTGSHLTSDDPSGLNATRHCDLRGGRYVEERVAEYEEGSRLTMEIYESNIPLMDEIAVRFDLEDNGNTTTVHCTPDYTLKYGAVGALADRAFVRRTYVKGMQALLGGLRRHVESAA